MQAASQLDRATRQSLLSPLSNLLRARKGLNEYYSTLLSSADPYLEFGAYHQLMRSGLVPEKYADRLLELCCYGGIKHRAFQYFQARYETTLATRVANTPAASLDDLLSAQMRARLAFDYEAALTSASAIYLETGNQSDLLETSLAAGRVGGWREAVAWSIRGAAIFPLDPLFFHTTLHELAEANQTEMVDELCGLLGRAGLHPYVREVYAAGNMLARGDYAECIKRLSRLAHPGPMAPRVLNSVLARAKKLLADANDRTGKFREAFGLYAEMNRLEQSPTVGTVSGNDPKSGPRFWKSLVADVPTLPPAGRPDVLMLLGFARSGTTLLENVLDGHPEIEAFEEVPVWDAAFALVRPQWVGKTAAKEDKRSKFMVARSTYYQEIEKRRKKSSAGILIDKYPMRTVFAAPLSKMLPDQKFIFCIRHPFDVVLSCFRQRFDANAATESFRTFKGTCEFYDMAMSQWFSHYTLTDPLVHYLKYDDLVTDFDAAVQETLDFVGVGWNEAVRDFAETSQRRVAQTPSYAKVRQGLSIGVQTYWRNYRFLFDSAEASVLWKWVKHFGYEAS